MATINTTELNSLVSINNEYYVNAFVSDQSNVNLAGSVANLINKFNNKNVILVFKGGHIYNFLSSITIPKNISIYPQYGATINPVTSATITINNLSSETGIYAWINALDGGRVVFSNGSTPFIRPEWYGDDGIDAIMGFIDSSNNIPMRVVSGTTYSFSTPVENISIVGENTGYGKAILEYSGSGTAITVGGLERHEGYWIKPGPYCTQAIKVIETYWTLKDLIVGYSSDTTNVANGILFEGIAGRGCAYGTIQGIILVSFCNGDGFTFRTVGPDPADYDRVYSITAEQFISNFNKGNGISWEGVQNIVIQQLALESNNVGFRSTTAYNDINVYNYDVVVQKLYIGNNTTNWHVDSGTFQRANISQFNTGSASDPPTTVLEWAQEYNRGTTRYVGVFGGEVIAPKIVVNNASTSGIVYRCLYNYDSTTVVETMRQEASGDMVWNNDTRLSHISDSKIGFSNIGDKFSLSRLHINVSTSQPSIGASIEIGDLVYADGSSWNPGSGSGLYLCTAVSPSIIWTKI